MRRETIPLGHAFGIPIGVDYSWFLVFALVTWTLATGYFPAEFRGWSPALYWVTGAVTALLFFASVVLHELGHSVVALRYKIPVRSITLFIFGGVAQIAAEPPSAAAEFWIALAGPAVSLGLAVAFVALQPLAVATTPALALVRYLAYINATLALFNLIPGFPLDGGRVFRAVTWAITRNLPQATRLAAGLGRIIAYGFILIGVWQLFTGNVANGLWIAFIGWFLESAATGQVEQLAIHELLAGHRVSEVMSRDCRSIAADLTLQDLVDRHIRPAGQRCFLVERDGEVVGMVTVHHPLGTPREEWPVRTVGQAMIPLADVRRIRPEAELWTALEEMDRDGVNQLPVMTDHQVLGLLTRDSVITFLRTLRELGPSARPTRRMA